MSATYYTTEMWESDNQTRILQNFGLDKEFAHGSNSIEKVAESLVVTRIWKKVLMSKLSSEQIHAVQNEVEQEIKKFHKEKRK
jgi:hypothetical protein